MRLCGVHQTQYLNCALYMPVFLRVRIALGLKVRNTTGRFAYIIQYISKLTEATFLRRNQAQVWISKMSSLCIWKNSTMTHVTIPGSDLGFHNPRGEMISYLSSITLRTSHSSFLTRRARRGGWGNFTTRDYLSCFDPRAHLLATTWRCASALKNTKLAAKQWRRLAALKPTTAEGRSLWYSHSWADYKINRRLWEF